jgi:hypothetical protein
VRCFIKKIVLTIFIVFSLFGFAGCDNLPNDVGSVEQIAAWHDTSMVEGIFAFHPKITLYSTYYDFRAVARYNIIHDTFGGDDFFNNRILIKGNTLYIYYRFYIEDNKTKIDCAFKVSGCIVSDDGIVEDDRTEFYIPITLGV